MSLSLSGKAAPRKEQPKPPAEDAPVEISSFSAADAAKEAEKDDSPAKDLAAEDTASPGAPVKSEPTAAPKMSMSLGGGKPKHVNPLMKNNPLSKKSEKTVAEPEKKMSNAERIMREEMERKRKADERNGPGGKRQRV